MTEHDSQVAVFQWAYIHEVRCPDLELLFAVPNAGKRSIGAARYYLAEGLRSGVWDVWLPVPKNGNTGLVIEMKYGKNKLSENQVIWRERLKRHGWKTAVCYSADECIKTICEYLGLVLADYT
jgi:hypothetical protein